MRVEEWLSLSVVALEDDLLAVPAEGFEAFAVGGDHFVEAADVGVHAEVGRAFGGGGWGGAVGGEGGVGADDPLDVLLDVAAGAFPLVMRAAEGGDVAEVGVLGGDALEVFLVIELRGVAGAVDQGNGFALREVGCAVGRVVRETGARRSRAWGRCRCRWR